MAEAEVFVVGSGRSGSTLLAALLSQHPRVNVGPESPYLGWLLHRPWRYRTSQWRKVVCSDLLQSPSFSLSGIDETTLQGLAATCASPKEVVTRLFTLQASRRDADTWIDKTPSNVLRLPIMARAFPSATFVHLVRDGRAVAESLIRAGWAPSIEAAAYNWRRRVTAGLRFEARHPDRVMRVRYEDVLVDPEGVVAKIWGIVGVHNHPGLLERFRTNTGGFELQTAFPDAHMSLWRSLEDPFQLTQLDRGQLRCIEMVQGDILEALGYDSVFAEASNGSSVALRAVLRTKWEVDRARRRRRIP